jgi:hypothetical protein
MSDIWTKIPNYNNYSVSEDGVVRRDAGYGCRKSRILKPDTDKHGYKKVTLSKNSKQKRFLVHRLVAEAFIPNVENKPHVNHKDSNRLNNRVCNLEWVTPRENQLHAYNFGNKDHSGSRNGRSILKEKDVLEIKSLLSLGKSCKSIATTYGVSYQAINDIRLKRRWRHL